MRTCRFLAVAAVVLLAAAHALPPPIPSAPTPALAVPVAVLEGESLAAAPAPLAELRAVVHVADVVVTESARAGPALVAAVPATAATLEQRAVAAASKHCSDHKHLTNLSHRTYVTNRDTRSPASEHIAPGWVT